MKKNAAFLFSLFLVGCQSGSVVFQAPNLVYQLPFSDEVKSLNPSLASSLSKKALGDLSDSVHEFPGSGVVSPASYLLAVAGLSSVSVGMDNASFGLGKDAAKDLSSLLEAWNFEYQYKEETDHGEAGEEYCRFDSVILHQQVGPTYRFDKRKQEALKSNYIATMQSSLSDYHQDAVKFFNEGLGYQITPPDPGLNRDGVITYGAFRMKDYVPGGMGVWRKLYQGKETDAYSFGSIYYPESLPYFKGENYAAFQIDVCFSDLLIVLPDVGASIDDVDFASAYEDFLSQKQNVLAMGYVPYFHLTSKDVDLTDAVAEKLTGKETFFDRLLEKDVENDLDLQSVLQASDFEFNQYGVSGESITEIAVCGSAAPEEHEDIRLEVNRPFYAISLKDNFPLFVNKVVSLSN